MWLKLILFISLSGSLSCDRFQSQASYLKKLKERGFVVFITNNSQTTYYSDKDNQWVGFEYDLARAFAKQHDLELRVLVAKNAAQAFQFLDDGSGDFIGASMVLTAERKERYRHTNAFFQTQQKVVCHRFGKQAKDRNALSSTNFVIAGGSSNEVYLQELAKVLKGLSWKNEDISTEELLAKVNEKQIDCTVSDTHTLSLQQRMMPDLTSMFSLSPEQGIHWYMSKDNYHLERILNAWLEKVKLAGVLQELSEKYFGFIASQFDYYDTKIFEDRMVTRLKEWKPIFIRASRITGLDWKLLAAISYQESHWDPSAVSPTGVKGLMMLTNATAERMGVSDRTDPTESIIAGAKYFLWLKKRFKKQVSEPDLTWIALAAYNVGHGHVDDIMELAKTKKLPHNKWAHVKDLLPLLSRAEIYTTLKYGYANGSEPLIYVDRVRNFYKIIGLKKKI